MSMCISLARADTSTSALDWFNSPLSDFADWTEALNELEKKRRK